MKKTIVMVYDKAVISGGAAKIAIKARLNWQRIQIIM